jgi:hypothetical protein
MRPPSGQEPRERPEAGGLVLHLAHALAERLETMADGPDGQLRRVGQGQELC